MGGPTAHTGVGVAPSLAVAEQGRLPVGQVFVFAADYAGCQDSENSPFIPESYKSRCNFKSLQVRD